MSSPSLLPADEQGGVGKLNLKQDVKNKKGTLTNLFKKSQELATKAAAEPVIVELLDEGNQQLPAECGMEDVTPAAPEDKEAETQHTEDEANTTKPTEPAAEEAQAAEDTSGDQVNLKILFNLFGRSSLVSSRLTLFLCINSINILNSCRAIRSASVLLVRLKISWLPLRPSILLIATLQLKPSASAV